MSDPRERLAQARLYLVCDAREDEFLAGALRGGVDIVQLRMKHASDADVLAAAERVRRHCTEHDALFIVNDRPDLALQAGADGVHVGQDDTPVAQARALVGPERIVGLSTHSAEQVDAAGTEEVDYIGVGPVHDTPTKPGRPAVGLELVGYAAAHARMPFFAIGGIDPGNVEAVAGAGAERIVVVRALTLAADPERMARRLLAGLTAQEAPVGSA